MALIELIDISKSFDGELVLDEFNLKIEENEFITLLGPSGCGKTTTLRMRLLIQARSCFRGRILRVLNLISAR